MADENPATPKETAEPEDPAAPEADAAGAPDAAADGASELETLRSEVADLNDRLLRMAAEMENLRKRTEREIADARQYAVAAFARDVLTVGDNLARALEAVPEEARAAGDGGLKSLADGVELTERELAKTLEKHGVKKLSPKGEKFDPNFHQAMFEVPRDDAPPGTVAEVVQDGYAISQRVLRPALVGVVKAPPKPEADPPAGAKDVEATAEEGTGPAGD